MVRLTLRQLRTEGVVAGILLVAYGVVLLVTGLHLVHVNDAFERLCSSAHDCATAMNPVANVDRPLQGALALVVVVTPALIGVFAGAPLIAGELETGTFRLAWTQSVSRRRWLAVKLGVVGIAAMAIGGLVTWMTDWWASPITAVTENRFGLAEFGLHGVAPLGYAAFAFALSACAGALVRRTVAAMAVTLLGFAGVRLGFTYWLRSHLVAPLRISLSLTNPSAVPGFGARQPEGVVSLVPPTVGVPNAWVYSTTIVGNDGAVPTSQDLARACPALVKTLRAGPFAPPTRANVGPAHARSALHPCLERLSATYHTVVTYQPGTRYWPFQWAEMGIFLAAAVTLCVLTDWWLRRRYA